MKRCVRLLFTQPHAGACHIFCKIVQHLSQEEITRCTVVLIFRPVLVRFFSFKDSVLSAQEVGTTDGIEVVCPVLT